MLDEDIFADRFHQTAKTVRCCADLNLAVQRSFYPRSTTAGCIYTEENAKRVKWILSKGHMLASHTWSHANLSTLTFDQRKLLFCA